MRAYPRQFISAPRLLQLPGWPFFINRDVSQSAGLVSCVVSVGAGVREIARPRSTTTGGTLSAQLQGVACRDWTVQASGDTSLDFTSGGWTIGAWVSLPSTPSGSISYLIQHFVYVSEANNQGWSLDVSPGSNAFRFISFNNNAAALYQLFSAAAPTAGDWLVIGSSDGSSLRKLYVNGLLDASTANSLNPAASNSNLLNQTGTTQVPTLAAFAWNRELSAAEISEMFNPGTRWNLFAPRRNSVFLVAPKPTAATFTANLTASVSPAGALANQPMPELTASVSPSGALKRTPQLKLAASSSPIGSLRNTPIKPLAGSVTPSGGLRRTIGTSLHSSVTPGTSLSNVVKKLLIGGVGPVGGMGIHLAHSMTAALSPRGRISAGVGEAPCNIPLVELRTRVWQMLDDDGTYYTLAEANHALNMAQRLFVLLTLCLEKIGTFNLTNGVYFYNVSSQISDFLCPLRVSRINPVGGAKVRLLSDTLHQMDARDDTWRNRPGAPVRYAQEGFDTFWITPQPASGVNVLQFVYAREPLVMSDDEDVPEIPPDQQIFLPDCAFFILRLKEGSQELQNAVAYLQRFLQAAMKYQKFVRAKTRGQLYDRIPYDLSGFDMSRLEIKLARPKSRPPTASQLKGKDAA